MNDKRRYYTVLLLYPDYVSDEFGHETFQAHVYADTVKQAVELAQQAALRDALDVQSPDDFFVLAVYAGWLDDIKEVF